MPALLTISRLADGRYIEVNEAFEETLKFRREEVIGRTALELGIWENPADRAGVVQKLRQGGKIRDLEARFRDRTGAIVIGLVSAEIIDIMGEECLLALTKDVTMTRRAEEEIETLNANLAAHALDLEVANQELEAFSYTVSHDLRAPLTNINGSSQVILELCADKLDEQCKGFVQTIRDETGRMDELIGTLLDFSRINRSEMHREAVDLSAMANSIALELREKEPQRGVAFSIAEEITADADEKLLRVALENLLGNAWKYTGKKETAVIGFGMALSEGKPAYFVRDDGAGFDMAYADKLFTPFQRLPGADEFKGTGIGLATVQRIIQRHGGRVWAEGEPGKGATFYFTL